jgi:hypothetical protein
VKRLVRIQIGQLSIDKLLVGQHRVLTQDDVKRYFPSGPVARPMKKSPASRVPKTKKELSHG